MALISENWRQKVAAGDFSGDRILGARAALYVSLKKKLYGVHFQHVEWIYFCQVSSIGFAEFKDRFLYVSSCSQVIELNKPWFQNNETFNSVNRQ